ncbi:MAG: DNA polymerase III subunit chi [Alphaproteobacteria bacterium]|nr:DNA polymerase III subunit chi [Alphaproteobacteria bacterium]
MVNISFYHLTRSPLDKALPKLLVKALDSGKRVVVMAAQDRLEELNARLWEADPNSFVPHGSRKDGFAEDQPVYLTSEEENPNGAEILCVTDGRTPSFLNGFSRVLDCFNGLDDAEIASARERWKAYKAAGHTLTYLQQTDAGGWEKKAG